MRRFADRVDPDPGPPSRRIGAGIPGTGFLLAVFLGLSIVSPPPLFPVEAAPEIPFGQKILTVLSEGIESVPPEGGDLSIPLTRLDVMVQDGIAFMRLIQVYRNHSETNQGFAFSLPLEPDTAVTGFTIWDRGTRYPGGDRRPPPGGRSLPGGYRGRSPRPG